MILQNFSLLKKLKRQLYSSSTSKNFGRNLRENFHCMLVKKNWVNKIGMVTETNPAAIQVLEIKYVVLF